LDFRRGAFREHKHKNIKYYYFSVFCVMVVYIICTWILWYIHIHTLLNDVYVTYIRSLYVVCNTILVILVIMYVRMSILI
jgi:hypothetical protein